MAIFDKLVTLARGRARESANVLLDAHAVTVFGQEIVDVEQKIALRKQALGEVIVARKLLAREIAAIEQLIEKRETQARRLLEDNAEPQLLEDIVTEIAEQESALEGLQQQHQAISRRIAGQEQNLRKALTQISHYRRDLRLAKAQRLSAAEVARDNNLPQQLSELDATRRQLQSLCAADEDRETAWVEMEGALASNNIDGRLQALGKDAQERKKAAVLKRLRQGAPPPP